MKNKGKLKVFIIIVSILLLFNVLVATIFHRGNTSFYTNEANFKYKSQDESKIIFEDNFKNLLTVVIKDDRVYNVTFAKIYHAYYKGRTIESNYSNDSLTITLSDGTKYIEKVNTGFTTPIRQEIDIASASNDLQIIYGIERVMDYLNNDSPLKIFSILALLTIIGTFLIVMPEVMWRITYFLYVKNGEPTEWAIGVSVLSGVILIIISIFLNIFLLI